VASVASVIMRLKPQEGTHMQKLLPNSATAAAAAAAAALGFHVEEGLECSVHTLQQASWRT